MAEEDTILFLHDMGYNFFNIGALTYPEINSLIKTKNRKVKKEEAMQKKAQRKNKMNRGKRR